MLPFVNVNNQIEKLRNASSSISLKMDKKSANTDSDVPENDADKFQIISDGVL